MPQMSDINVDPLLTRIAKAYKSNQFIADRLFPRIPVQNETGYYYVYDQSSLRLEDDLRAGLARANRVDYGLDLDTYGPLLEHSLEQGITKRERRIMGDEKARRRAVNNVMKKIMLRHEYMVASILTDPAIITQGVDLDTTARWSDASSSDPIGDIKTGRDTIFATGIAGERLVLAMGYPVWSALQVNDQLINRLGTNTDRTAVTMQQAAAILGVDEIIVGRAMIDSAKEGQSPSLSYVWGNDAILMLMQGEGEESIEQVNPGYTLYLEEEAGRGGPEVDRWFEQSNKGEFVRATDFFEPKLVAAEACYLIQDAGQTG